MRLGKWIRIFDRTVPIPTAFSSSFGLRGGSQLYLAPMRSQSTPQRGDSEFTSHRGDAEIIVSPIPTASWRSVCRLSVRLHDTPRALAKASAFLRDNRISILLTEAAATFQERAHWDAVCDLQACPDFSSVSDQPFDKYETAMAAMLSELSEKLSHWATAPHNKGVFLSGVDAHASFTALTGLNIASFRCNLASSHRVPFRSGGMDLPTALVNEIKRLLARHNGFVAPIPSHALITGNTEQRYLRLYFIRNVDEFVISDAEFTIGNIAGDGIGMLHQILHALPESMNLLHLALHRVYSSDDVEKRLVRIIGHWPDPEEAALRQAIDSLEIEDIDGGRHGDLVRLVNFSMPHLVNPRVFISYSISVEAERLALLRNLLIENNFDPVLGTDLGDGLNICGDRVAADVVGSAFQQIPTCVAFISLQTKRKDFQLDSGRFILPPWIVAEEVFAYSRGVYFLARLRERGVEDPRYNKNTFEFEFESDAEFEACVATLMESLNRARLDSKFQGALQMARQAQYKARFPPS